MGRTRAARPERESLARRPRLDLLLLALIVFALPLFIWPGTTDYNYAKCVFFLVAVSVVTVVHAAAAARREDHVTYLPWIALPALGLVAVSLVSLVGAADARVGLQSLVLALAFLQFAFLVVNVARERRDVNVLLWALLASAVCVALHAVLQYVQILPGTDRAGPDSMIAAMGNQDAVGGFLAYILFPAVILVAHPRSRILRVALGLLVLGCLVVVLLTQQMGVVLGVIAAVPTTLLGWVLFPPGAKRGRRPLVLLLLVTALLAATAAYALTTSPGAKSSWMGRLWESNSGGARTYFWSVGRTMLREHPITGVGLGNYKIAYLESEVAYLAEPGATPAAPTLPNAAQAHSDYIQAAAETGILGILAVAGLLSVLFASFWKRLCQNAAESRRDLLLLSAGVVVFLVHALVGFPAHLAPLALSGLLLASLALSRAYGTACTLRLRLSPTALRVALGVAILVGFGISIMAGRDLAANLLQQRGTHDVQMGRNREALDALRRSISLDFAPRQSYFFLASAQYRLGMYEEALDSLEKCLSRFPDENAYLLYADLAAGLGQLDPGLEALDLLLSTRPLPEHETKARYVRALILREKGDLSGSEAALRELIAQSPGYEPSYISLGDMFSRGGRTDEARALYEEALRLVEDALPSARAAASGTSPTTYAAYARARDRLNELTSEQETILRDLEALGRAEPVKTGPGD